MTRMTGPDCVVMCNLINTHTHTHTHTRTHWERSRVEDQALAFRTQHYLCRHEVASSGSQQLRAQDPAPVRRCGTEVRTGHQGRERGGDGNRDGGGNGNGSKDEYGDEHEGTGGGKNGSDNEGGDGSRNGSGNGRESARE